MTIQETSIKGLLIIKPRVFTDERGYFFESYNMKSFKDLGIDDPFLQDNQSLSQKGVLRGLHFQNPPFAQGKLVRVINGSVIDVAVDIRKNSPTYGKHEKIFLSGKNKTMFWIPPGFAHGFITLEDNTLFSYKCTALYNKSSEGSIIWNDENLNIDWEYPNPLVSSKDQGATKFEQLDSQFIL